MDDKTKWLKRASPALLVRWAVFSLIIGGIALANGAELMEAALLGLGAGGVLNIAWCWVA